MHGSRVERRSGLGEGTTTAPRYLDTQEEGRGACESSCTCPSPAHAVEQAPRTTEGSLTRRAMLTFVSNLLEQPARFVVGFLITPIIIRGLGPELYGAWTMIQQSVGYLTLSDMRPMGTLKFTLAVRQHVEDLAEKRRQVGAAIIIWAATCPVLLVVGAGIIWAAPFIIQTAPASVGLVRGALALVVLGVAIDRLVSLPANVLRGMNLDYKAMGLDAATTLVVGGLSVVAIRAGWGLLGVAGASMAAVLIPAAVCFAVVRRVLPWFGAARPTRAELGGFARLSGWLVLSALSGLLLNSSDLLLVGRILGPSVAAIYATTGAVLRLTTDPVSQLLSSGNAGISELCGRSEWVRISKLRSEMHVFAIGIMTVIGTGVIALNHSFMRLWVGTSFYAGDLTNLLLVLAALTTVLFRVDGVLVDSMLEFRPKAISTLAVGAMILILGASLTPRLGPAGMALAMVAGYLGLLVYLQLVIARRTGLSPATHLPSILRPMLVAGMLYAVAFSFARLFQPETWIVFLACALSAAAASMWLVWQCGFGREQRRVARLRIATLVAKAKTSTGSHKSGAHQ
jgi:O-antigen/teichoic acid export membrane protein